MKIVLPVHHFLPRYSAGAELYTLGLARWLRDHGHTVEVVGIESLDYESQTSALNVVQDQFEGLTVWRVEIKSTAADWWPYNYDNPQFGQWFADYLCQSKPDLIHFQAGYLIGAAPLRAAVAARIPTVLTLHDYWFLCPRITLQRGDGSLCDSIPEDPAGCEWCMGLQGRSHRLADQLTNGLAGQMATRFGLLPEGRRRFGHRRSTLLKALAAPDVVIAPSRYLANRFAPFLAPKSPHLSRYGLDLTRFREAAQRAVGQTLRVGYTGQIARHKGVHLLVAAFRKLNAGNREIELHIYGGLEANAPYVEQLRRSAGGDPRIHFHGRFDNRLIPSMLAELDVHVVPSVWYENSPIAIMEAQAAGNPVITAALGGMAEMVRHEEDGLLFRPADADDLARQLQRLIDEPELLPRLRAGVKPPRAIEDEMLHLMEIYTGLIGKN
jgi:glycosyltransferase involved in cell wall biosynthesis